MRDASTAVCTLFLYAGFVLGCRALVSGYTSVGGLTRGVLNAEKLVGFEEALQFDFGGFG